MRRVLVVSYFYPPLTGMGALRIGKFVKYLPEFGYQPFVLAGGDKKLKQPEVFRPFFPDLVSLAKQRSNQSSQAQPAQSPKRKPEKPLSEVIQSLGLMSGVGMPDVYLLWALTALPQGLRIIKKYRPDIIFSSHSPPSSHIAASFLQALFNLPWVAEFRDPWANNPYSPIKPKLNHLDAILERRVLRRANRLVTVARPLAAYLRSFHGKPVDVIYNGFDEADYPLQVNCEEYFTITYTGIILSGKRDPTSTFQAVKMLATQGLISPKKFRLRFYGPFMNEKVQPLAEKFSVLPFCEFHQPVSYQEALYRQCQSDILLLLEWNSDKPVTVPGKVFEYLGANRPILCTGYRFGPLAEIIETCNMGVVLNDPSDIADYILRMYQSWEADPAKSREVCRPAALSQYTRRHSAEKLAQIFDQTLSPIL